MAILQFSRLLASLPPRVRAIRRTAEVKEFDIGIQAGSRPSTAEWVLNKDAVAKAAKLGARIRLTVYAPDLSALLRTPPPPQDEKPAKAKARKGTKKR